MKPLNAIAAYFQGVAGEIRKVVWPTFPELTRYFFSVVIGVLLATAFIGAVDYLFIRLLAVVLNG